MATVYRPLGYLRHLGWRQSLCQGAAMMLRADSKYPTRRTYVVKLRSDATAETLCGRLENLVTGKQSDFTSAGELFDLIARDVDSCGAELPSSP